MALQLDPTLDSARLALADVLREAFQVDEAAVEYATYLKRNPNSPEGHVGAGQIALLTGDLVAAAKHFETALAIKPDDPIAIRESGLIRLRNGQFASARDLFKRAVDLAPFEPSVRFNYARALEKSGDHAGAEREKRESDRLRAEDRHGEELRRSLASRPGDTNLRSEVARWLVEHGHEKEGLEWTELILREAPGHPPTCRLLAEYHAKHGNAGLANYYRMTGNASSENR
jgi:predicted Zn-dependent protease